MGFINGCSLYLLLFTVIVSAEAVTRAYYGQRCSSEVRCDSRSFLACSQGVCECFKPKSTVYDFSIGQCVTTAGERCVYTTTVEGDRSWSNVAPCISKSSCKNGVCECDSGYYPDSYGACQQKRRHGEECTNNNMCQENHHLVCGDAQKCICQENRVFTPRTRECALRAGETCGYEDNCTDFSNCFFKCQCQSGYFPSADGTCVEKLSLGEDCEQDEQCKDTVFLVGLSGTVPSFLKCLDGKCNCHPTVAKQFFDENEGKFLCGKALHAPCSPGGNDVCITGAKCDRATQTCRCEYTTHFTTENNTCDPRRGYGQPCSESAPCNYVEKRVNCSGATNTCVCAEGWVPALESQECRGSPGTGCGEGKYPRCVSNAKCNENEKCECEGDTRGSESRQDYCYVEEGGPCYGDLHEPVTTRTCLPGLLCSNRTCACPYKDYQVYDRRREKCVGKLVCPCGGDSDCEENHSVCAPEPDGSGPLQCRCKRGYIAVRGECQIAFGEKCGKREADLCDTAAPLGCSSRGICECAKLQVYDNQTEICRGLVGAKCVPRQVNWDTEKPSYFCVEGAFCQKIRGSAEKIGACRCKQGWRGEADGTCRLVTKITGGLDKEEKHPEEGESAEEIEIGD